jgi:protein phosphatase
LKEEQGAMLDVIFGEATHPGKVRTNNEDSFISFVPKSRQIARSHGWMFALADGVGGSDFGEVASSTAVSTIAEGFAKAQEETSLVALMPRLIQHANAEIHNHTLTPERRGKKMASTIVCCGLRHDLAVVSHVGDSRCYHVRDGEATSVTRDHTWVNEQRKLGLITATEALESEARHVLTRSLGPELFVSADTTSIRVEAGDVLVLCSDGLYGALTDQQIADFVTRGPEAQTELQKVAERLVAYAVEVDGSDNTTAQVIRIRSVERVGMYRGRTYRLP